jgi:hypothetical protein
MGLSPVLNGPTSLVPILLQKCDGFQSNKAVLVIFLLFIVENASFTSELLGVYHHPLTLLFLL